MTSTGTFPKSARLRKRAEFVRLLDAPHKCTAKGFLIVWQANDLVESRLGITVSRKVGCAVIRNRIKRYIRETFRCLRQGLPVADINIIARREAALMDFCSVRQELEKAFRRIGTSTCSRAVRSS